MTLMPGMSYEVIQDFNWLELKAWHEIAIDTYKTMKGIQ